MPLMTWQNWFGQHTDLIHYYRNTFAAIYIMIAFFAVSTQIRPLFQGAHR